MCYLKNCQQFLILRIYLPRKPGRHERQREGMDADYKAEGSPRYGDQDHVDADAADIVIFKEPVPNNQGRRAVFHLQCSRILSSPKNQSLTSQHQRGVLNQIFIGSNT